jgi:CubicO group peptidase (beta-lactamase class C family)
MPKGATYNLMPQTLSGSNKTGPADRSIDSVTVVSRLSSWRVIFPLVACVFFATTAVSAKDNNLRQQLEDIKQHTGVGAVAYALVEKNKIISTVGMGQYGLHNKRAVTADSLFRIGSITKTFTSLAVMKLVEQNQLQLNQTIKTLTPDLPLQNPWPKTPVTLAMLLEHTAGLQDLTQEEFDYPAPLSITSAFKVKPETKKVNWPPGYHYSYSNIGAGYVGRAIEIVTKENYDNWFEREILAKLGMHDSQLHWTKKLQQNLVTGYDADLKKEIPYWHTLFRPFGGLSTTARDMAKFLLLFTDESSENNNIISTSAIKRMETAETSLSARTGLDSSYGLGIRGRYFNGHKIYGHGGDADGYLAEFAYSKDSHRAYFVVINAFRHDILEAFTEQLDHWLIVDLVDNEKISPPPVKSLAKKTIDALAGDYRKVTKRFPSHDKIQAETIRIKNIDNEIYRCFPRTDSDAITSKNRCTKILAVTENLFRTEKQSYASMAFIYAPDKNIYLQTGFGNYKKINNK